MPNLPKELAAKYEAEIVAFLDEHPGEWFLPAGVARGIGCTRQAAWGCLARLVRRGECRARHYEIIDKRYRVRQKTAYAALERDAGRTLASVFGFVPRPPAPGRVVRGRACADA